MSESIKVLVRFPSDLLKRLEDYRHNNRIASRHQAILNLIEKALDAEDAK